MGRNFGSGGGGLDPNPCFPGGRVPCGQDGEFVGMFGRTMDRVVKLRQVEDGLTNTFMVGETIASHWRHNSLWGNNFQLSSTHIPFNSLNAFDDLAADPNASPEYWLTSGFKSFHPGGAHMMTGDGAVHFLSENIDYYAYNALGTTAGGETDARLQ
jgi:hypothetical protein